MPLGTLWTPLLPLELPHIRGLKELNTINEGKATLELLPGSSMNNFLSKEIFSPNATVVNYYAKCNVKISCNFDFAKYPFDHQNCSLQMVMDGNDINITIHDITQEITFPSIREIKNWRAQSCLKGKKIWGSHITIHHIT